MKLVWLAFFILLAGLLGLSVGFLVAKNGSVISPAVVGYLLHRHVRKGKETWR